MEFLKDPVQFLEPETTPSGVRTTCSSSPRWLGTPWAAPLGTFYTPVDSFFLYPCIYSLLISRCLELSFTESVTTAMILICTLSPFFYPCVFPLNAAQFQITCSPHCECVHFLEYSIYNINTIKSFISAQAFHDSPPRTTDTPYAPNDPSTTPQNYPAHPPHQP